MQEIDLDLQRNGIFFNIDEPVKDLVFLIPCHDRDYSNRSMAFAVRYDITYLFLAQYPY